jgi:hypothetical protein
LPLSKPVNAARGEVSALLAGRPHRLCLTLGALAEMETAFDRPGAALGERLKTLSAQDMLTVLAALLRGGGEAAAAEALADMAVDPREAAEAVAAAFTAAAA